jgi:hypothetical protein
MKPTIVQPPNLFTNPDVRTEQVNGQDRLTLTGLDKLDKPSSLIALRGQIDSLLPRTDLTDRYSK